MRNLPSEFAGVINFTLELVHTRDVWHFGVAAGTSCRNQAVKPTKRRVIIDNPSRLIVLLEALDFDAKLGLLVQAVVFPQLLNLLYNFLASGIAALPFDSGMKAVHEGVDLEARCFIDPL